MSSFAQNIFFRYTDSMSIWGQIFCVILSSCITTLAIPNEFFYFGSPVLGLFALVPLYFSLYYARSFKNAAVISGAQIGLTHLLSSFWLANFKDFAIFTLGASAIGTIVQGIAAGCYLYTLFADKSPLTRAPRFGPVHRALFFALVWTFYEWAKSLGFLGYPWGTLSMTAVTWNEIKQIAEFTGERGITFLFAFFSSVAAEGLLLLRAPQGKTARTEIRTQWIKSVALCAALFAAAHGYGVYQVNKKIEPQKIIRAAIVQQNIDTWLISDAESIAVSQRLTEDAVADGLARTGFRPDIAAWSEAVLEYPMPEFQGRYWSILEGSNESLSGFIARMSFPFLVGGAVTFDREKNKYGNAVLFFNQNGQYENYYAKIHLVPFAEVLPYTDIPFVKKAFDVILGFSDAWTPGTELTLFEIPVRDKDGNQSGQTVKFATPICFEDAFGDMCRALFWEGSEVFINLTNDAWSLTKSAEYQHYAIASYRAIEFRTTLVRSTNAGYSVVLDSRGKVLNDLPLFEEGFLFTEIPVYARVITFYARYGDVFIYAVLFLAALMIGNAGCGFRRFQRRDY